VSDRTPHVELRLVEWVAELFPNRVPNEGDSEREIWMAVGAQKVVRKLANVAQIQAGNILDEDVLRHD
jgi:hypothetical protein